MKKKPRFRILVRVLAYSMVIGLISLALFALYLDARVRTAFEGRRFALPARVYARPLELYPGARIGAEDFARELQRLGYRKGLAGSITRRYQRDGDDFDLVTPPFVFWDGEQDGQYLHLAFAGDRLAAIVDFRDQKPITLARLDPEYLGGIYPGHNEDRVLVKLSQVPVAVVNGLIAVEDHNFYSHFGIDPRGMARALVSTLSGGEVQGGSTLTQQLVKNFFLTPERTLKRKATEILMALLLERHFSKDDILETYINEVYLGQDKDRAIHGFGLAAQFYFDKRIEDLDLPEAALLVGMVKGPSYYDPRRHPDRALARRNLALAAMLDRKYISQARYLEAKSAPLGVVDKPAMGTTLYPAFLDLVRRQLLSYYRETDLRSEGLRIFTTLDPRVQEVAENSLADRLAGLDMRLPSAGKNGAGAGLEGAVVVADLQSGEIQGLVGGRDPRYPGFNRAVDLARPVGSLLKPAVYLTALANPGEYTLVTKLDDGPLVWQEPGRPTWMPSNYDHLNHGLVELRTALANSYNVATARLGEMLGVSKVLDRVRLLGIDRELPPYAASLLGAVDLSPLDVAQMYQTIGSGGFRAPLRAIREVLTADGKPLQHYGLDIEQTIEPGPDYLLTSALQGVVRNGTGRDLAEYLPPDLAVAGKTGTTDDFRDSWFAGFTGDRVAAVWIGYDDNRPTNLTGASGALPVWGELMARLRPEPLAPPLPDSVELVSIDPASGLRADRACVGAEELPFIRGSAPAAYAPCAHPVSTTIRNWFQRLFD